MKIRFLIFLGLLVSTFSFAEEEKQKELGLSDLVGTWQAETADVVFEYIESGILKVSKSRNKLQVSCDVFTKAKGNDNITENILLMCGSKREMMIQLIKFLNKDQITVRASLVDEEVFIFNRKK